MPKLDELFEKLVGVENAVGKDPAGHAHGKLTDLKNKHGVTHGKLDGVDEKVRGNSDKLDQLGNKHGQTHGKLDEVKGKQGQTHAKLDDVNEKVTGVKGAIAAVADGVDGVSQQVEGVDLKVQQLLDTSGGGPGGELEAIAAAVQALQASVDSLSAEQTRVNTFLYGLYSRVNTVAETVSWNRQALRIIGRAVSANSFFH